MHQPVIPREESSSGCDCESGGHFYHHRIKEDEEIENENERGKAPTILNTSAGCLEQMRYRCGSEIMTIRTLVLC